MRNFVPTDHPLPHLALAPPRLEPGRLELEPPSPLAPATGDHLAPELADRVLELRARRAAIWPSP
ncbi:MAG: hypothetical protein ACR2NB_11140 [Solirubrobacteraceae bacterium]